MLFAQEAFLMNTIEKPLFLRACQVLIIPLWVGKMRYSIKLWTF